MKQVSKNLTYAVINSESCPNPDANTLKIGVYDFKSP